MNWFETNLAAIRPRVWNCLLASLLVCSLVGCHEPEGVRSYTVKKSPPPNRMLAAIIPRDKEAWFFKLTGSNVAAAAVLDGFQALIKSVHFSEGETAEPQWTLPSGWKQQPGNEMRFATITAEANGETVECSVSRLPRTSQPLDDFLLANINRWRGQMRLAPLDQPELTHETSEIAIADGKLNATIINIAGELTTGGMGAAPFAGKGRDAPSSSTPASVASKISFEAPSEWTPGELEISRGGISVRRDAAFEVKAGDQRVEITVTKLPAGPGAALPNLNRWRGQIGLPALTPEQVEQEKKQIEFAGTPADYVQFAGEKQTVLGVLAERNGLMWFVKLQGDSELAVREQKNFEGFVRSIRLDKEE